MTNYEWIDELNNYLEKTYNISISYSLTPISKMIMCIIIYKKKPAAYRVMDREIDFEDFKEEIYSFINMAIDKYKIEKYDEI